MEDALPAPCGEREAIDASATAVGARARPRTAEARRLRVVLILKTAQGGLWTLAHVDELRRRGHHVVAILPSAAGRLREALNERGVQIVDSGFSFHFGSVPQAILGLLRLRGQIRELRPDVVHYHLYASALAARISTVGMHLTMVHMVAGPLYLDSSVIRPLERILSRLDHVTIGGSEHTSRRYRALGLSRARTPTIPYGVDPSHFVPSDADRRRAARAALGLSADDFVVIMVAYVYAPKKSVHAGRGIKGHEVLLSAWRQFRPAHQRAWLLLVGGGFDAAGEVHRRYLADRFQVADDPSVVWTPSIADVRDHYAAADVSVSPSLSDNHGAAVEASAMGVPCIVSDAGALPETVDCRSGWVVPGSDVAALVAALDSAYAEFEAGTLTDRGDHARARMVRMFDSHESAAQVADVIEATVSRRELRR